MSTLNPYNPLSNFDAAEPAAFAGRREAFARLHQHLKDSSSTGALVFTGWHLVGKTAFLYQFDNVFDDSLIGVYLPLLKLNIQKKDDFLRGLIDATVRTLADRDFTLARVPETSNDIENLQTWLVETWLPEIRSAVRHHRRIIWLLDDAQVLAELDPEIFSDLNTLLINNPYVKLVMTIHTEYETALNHMSVLVKPTDIVRLSNLTHAETSALLCEPVRDRYTLTDDAANEAYRITGGQPQWVQRLGFHLYRQRGAELVTAVDVKALVPSLYAQSQDEMETVWKNLADNERLILTAISNLLHADPLRSLDSSAISTWLVETDYPMDETAVHAAIRSLEYREILAFHGQNLMEVRMLSGLFERWLLENARTYITEKRLTNSPSAVTPGIPVSRPLLVIIAGIIALIVLIIATLNLANAPQPVIEAPQPTVTLIRQP